MSSRLLPGQKFYTVQAVQRLLSIDRNRLMPWLSVHKANKMNFGSQIPHKGKHQWFFNLLEMYGLMLFKRLSDLSLSWEATVKILGHFTASDWDELPISKDNFLLVCDPGIDGEDGRGTVGKRLVFKRESNPDRLKKSIADCRIAVVINLLKIKNEVDGILSQAEEGKDFIISE